MRALVLSDVHGNLEALDAVLAAAEPWDALWNLGDMVGYGASPNEVLDRLRPIATLTVRGNHDRVCCGLTSSLSFNPTARRAAQWTQEQLTPDNLRWLRAVAQGPIQPSLRPPYAVLSSADPESAQPSITLAHGSPLNEDHYILTMRDAWAPLQQMASALTFIGHTHVQGGFFQKDHDWHELRPRYTTRNEPETWTLAIPPGTRHLINPGSVGQPRDADWRAGFALFDSDDPDDPAANRSIAYHRVPYDLTSAQGRILMAGLPERLAARLREGR